MLIGSLRKWLRASFVTTGPGWKTVALKVRRARIMQRKTIPSANPAARNVNALVTDSTMSFGFCGKPSQRSTVSKSGPARCAASRRTTTNLTHRRRIVFEL